VITRDFVGAIFAANVKCQVYRAATNGEVTTVIPPRFVFEHLRSDPAAGFVTRETETDT
jgi:hypothetical protein